MTATQDVPTLTLNTGATIPQVGFGVFQVPPEDAAETVRLALQAGYRSIDTASMYENEQGVGEAIADSGLPRDELFVTTKLGNDDHGDARAALDASLERLGLDYVDLYLIHWPIPSEDRYMEAWKAMEGAQADGLARAIGVSNFHREHLERLFDEGEILPAVNQIELHPRFSQSELRGLHAECGILTEAWSPLAQGDVLEDDAIAAIAEAHDRTPAQVILRWHVQLGNVVIPKSVTPERIEANIDVVGFELSDEEMERITGLDAGEGARSGPHPDSFPR